MRFFVFLVLFGLSLQTAVAMREFDELAERIADDIRVGREVSPKSLEDWIKSGDPKHISSVCEQFLLPENLQLREQFVQKWQAILEEDLDPSVHPQFRITMQKVSSQRKGEVVVMLLNSMVGQPS